MNLDISARDFIIRELIRVLECTQETYYKLRKLSDLVLIEMYKKLVPVSKTVFIIDGDYILLKGDE